MIVYLKCDNDAFELVRTREGSGIHPLGRKERALCELGSDVSWPLMHDLDAMGTI